MQLVIYKSILIIIIICCILLHSLDAWKPYNSFNKQKSSFHYWVRPHCCYHSNNVLLPRQPCNSIFWSSSSSFGGGDTHSTCSDIIPFIPHQEAVMRTTNVAEITSSRNPIIKQLRPIHNDNYNNNYTESAAPIQIRKITIKSFSNSSRNNIIFQRRPLGGKITISAIAEPNDSNIGVAMKAKTNRIKLEWIAESAKKLLPTNSATTSSTTTTAQQIVRCLADLRLCVTQKDVILVGNKIRQLLALDEAEQNNNDLQQRQFLFNHKDIVERLIKACSIVGLIDISLQLLLHLLLVQNYTPDSKAYVAVLQCLRKRGQVTKMKYVLDTLSEVASTNSTAAAIDVVAFNLYLAALCEEVLQEGRPTATLPLLQRLQHAIELLKPGVSLEKYHVCPDVYSYNTVLNAISQVQVWNNKTIIINNIQKWMAANNNITASEGLGSTRDSNKAFFSGDVVTINALIRGHIEASDYTSALELIDEHILLKKSCGGGEVSLPSSVLGNSQKITADRYTIDLAIQPLLQQNRTADVLWLIRNFAKLSEAQYTMDYHPLADTFAAFLTRIAIGARNPALAEQLLHEMYHQRDTNNMPPPSTRHYNVIIEGYRRLLSRHHSAEGRDGSKATSRLWRTMIDRAVLPDKYTLTSIIAQYTIASEIKQTWAESMQSLGMNPTEIICTSLITQLGLVGDSSASCAVFDWMLYCDKNGRTLPRNLRIWNALLGALVSRSFLSQKLNITLSKDVETWLRYDRIKSQQNVISCLGDESISEKINGMAQLDAAKFIFNMMVTCSKSDSSIPSPDSQSFCLMAAALAREAEQTATDQITTVGSRGRKKVADEAMDLFRLSIHEQIPADGRFLNAIIRCFGSDVASAIEAWKTEIGRVARAYNRKKKLDGGSSSAVSTGNNNLMVRLVLFWLFII